MKLGPDVSGCGCWLETAWLQYTIITGHYPCVFGPHSKHPLLSTGFLSLSSYSDSIHIGFYYQKYILIIAIFVIITFVCFVNRLFPVWLRQLMRRPLLCCPTVRSLRPTACRETLRSSSINFWRPRIGKANLFFSLKALDILSKTSILTWCIPIYA